MTAWIRATGSAGDRRSAMFMYRLLEEFWTLFWAITR
jgi:hypothetical protein